MPDFRDALVATAEAELARFAGRKETDPDVHDILLDYWMNGAGLGKNAANKAISTRTAWSAAFISFVVRKALSTSGSAAKFTFSGSHSVYIGAAIRNQIAHAPGPGFFGVPPTGLGAVAPQVGDIYGGTRTRTIDDYAAAMRAARDEDTYFSHCDIVTEIRDGQVTGIGGNVSDSVSRSKVALKNGILPIRPFKFNQAGQVLSGPFICLIQHQT